LIKIKFNSSIPINSQSFLIYIDELKYDYQVLADELLIDESNSFGVHTLRIESTICQDADFEIRFVDFVLNESSIRHTLYLGFSLKDKKQQYTTIINKNDTIWYLPYGNPVSWWLSECMLNIPNSFYGKDLNDSLAIYFPESVQISDHYPQLIKDFFLYNFGFTAHYKDINKAPLNNTTIPYLKLNLDYNEDAIYQEFINNIDELENQKYVPGQVSYNNKDLPDKKPWYITLAVSEERITVSRDKFPEYYKLLESLEGVTVKLSFIGSLHPGSFIAPHIDDLYQHIQWMEKCKGLCQIFIPIGWKPGNYFKASKVGLLPWEHGALLFNNTSYPHASINQSNSVRFTIGLMCEFHDDTFLKYIET
jgi:hypothetical protein